MVVVMRYLFLIKVGEWGPVHEAGNPVEKRNERKSETTRPRCGEAEGEAEVLHHRNLRFRTKADRNSLGHFLR